MNRRSFCALGGTGLALLSGCLSASPPANISTSAVTVERGQTEMITVHAENIRTIGFKHNWASHSGLVKYEIDGVSPHPNGGLDSYPPYWLWDAEQATVELILPVSPEPDRETGVYRWTVQSWKGTNTAMSPDATATTTIKVV